jgi:S-adenosylmethionine synthetase
VERLTVVARFLERSSKVDLLLMQRHIAKNLVAAGVADEILVQVSTLLV